MIVDLSYLLANVGEEEHGEYLEAEGWTVTVAWGHSHGVDIKGHRGPERLYLEAKGEAVNPPQQVNYFLGALGELVQRLRDPSAVYGLALPDNRQYQGMVDRLPPLAWERLRVGGRLAGISFHSLEDRRVKRFLTARAQGCICPPDLPVCGCGRTPEAELITRRSVAPSAGEIAHNPRSASARLRAARKLEVPSP